MDVPHEKMKIYLHKFIYWFYLKTKKLFRKLGFHSEKFILFIQIFLN